METIVPDLHLIDLSGVNVCLWTGENGPTLIDTGFPWSVDKLLAEMAQADVAPTDLQRIIITHADIDHIGGLKALKAQTQAPICCHAVEEVYVRGEKRKARHPSLMGLLIRPMPWAMSKIYKTGVPHVEEIVVEKKRLSEGFTILHMPGHAPGQIALHHRERGILIAGDALSNRGGKLSLPPKLFTPSVEQAIESLGKLKKLKFETACFGHGPPILSGADQVVNAFVETLAE